MTNMTAADRVFMEQHLQTWPVNLVVDPISLIALITFYEGFTLLRKETDVGDLKDFEIRKGPDGWFEIFMNIRPTEGDTRDRITARISVAVADGGLRSEGFIRFVEHVKDYTYKRDADRTTRVANYDTRAMLLPQKA